MSEQETKVFHVSNLMKGQVSRDLFVFSFATYLIQIKTIHIAISFCFLYFQYVFSHSFLNVTSAFHDRYIV